MNVPSVLTVDEMLALAPERGESWRPVPGEGELKPELVLIKDKPTPAEYKAGKPLMGKDGIPVRQALAQNDVRFYATFALPFYSASEPLLAAEARIAAGVLAEELRRLAPKRVMLLGANAAKWASTFAVPFRNFKEVAGRTIQVGDTSYCVGPAPAAIAFSPQVFADFQRAVLEFLNPGNVTYPAAPERETYLTLTNRLQADRLLKRLPQRIAVDVETNGLDPFTCRILTLQVAPEPGVGYAFPWELFSPDEWAGYLGGKTCVFQRGTFDAKVLAVNGLYLRVAEDTYLMHSLVDETPGTHAMGQLAPRYLGIDKWEHMVDYDAIEQTPLSDLGRYGARDADITLRLADHFKPLTQERTIHTVLHNAQNALVRAELRGVKVDREAAQRMLAEVEGHLHDKQGFIEDVYGLKNANSPQQVAQLLYEQMGLPVQRLRGRVTTNEEALMRLADEAPVVRHILEYRRLSKVRGTYLENILKHSQRDGRYHGEFNLAGTETGRLTEPLLLVLPRPDELLEPDLGEQYRVRLRELFVPDEGYVMVGADFRGLEVGMAAFLSFDPQLIHDYNTNLDTHSVVAIDAFNLPVAVEPRDTLKKRVSAEYALERTHAKSGTFAWLYGGDANTIRRNLGVTREVADSLITALTSRYAGVAAWQAAVKEQVLAEGRISTPWGRTRRFVFQGVSKELKEAQLREAINCTNQGMSSDMTLAGFTRLEALGVEMLFPMHDAVYAQAKEDDADKVAALIKDTLEGVLPGPVAWEADVKLGANWGQL